ncbi:MAG: hypothetical protein IPL40_07730 [Proteobacteria bacterium]|nr:hypothetical protein [Pseudomonadota bacterium]
MALLMETRTAPAARAEEATLLRTNRCCRRLALALAAALTTSCSFTLDFDLKSRESVDAALDRDAMVLADGALPRDRGGSVGRDAGSADGRLRDARVRPDGPPGACDEAQDSDHDTILDRDEGCALGRDSDDDGTPDYLDDDSDGDGITDAIEAGDADPLTPPVDTDRDNFADAIDLDSDNDGVLDALEDHDGNAHVGCCRRHCGEVVAGCAPVAADACGPGQQCTGGAGGGCAPLALFACSQGESDPRLEDTFGLGTDALIGAGVCVPSTPLHQGGQREVSTHTSGAALGDWTLALDARASYTPLSASSAPAGSAAAAFELVEGTQATLGFVVTLPLISADVRSEADRLITAVRNSEVGRDGAVRLRASGAPGRSHDGFDLVSKLVVDLVPSAPWQLAEVRRTVLEALMGAPAVIQGWPATPRIDASFFVLRAAVVMRKDGRAVFVVALTTYEGENAAGSELPWVAEDVASGTLLGRAGRAARRECESTIPHQSSPPVDIIWVIDESFSMSDNRADIASNAAAFFGQALAAGLDFRMGVTNIIPPDSSDWGDTGRIQPTVGRFCSRASSDPSDGGGADRFLLPSEGAIFAACVRNPPGYEGGDEWGMTNARRAVERHLPRAAPGDAALPSRIRQGAETLVIIVTDEVPQDDDLDYVNANSSQCVLPAETATRLETDLQPYFKLFTGQDSAFPGSEAIVHVIGGLCPGSCDNRSVQIAHGYLDLSRMLGGQTFDICQPDLGPSMQVILEDLLAKGSPLKLAEVPISASLRVTLDGRVLPRSRAGGFVYHAATNAIVLLGLGRLEPDSVVTIAYARWEEP